MDTGAILLLATQAARIYLDLSVLAGVMTREEAEAQWAGISARYRQADDRWEQSKKG